MQEKDVFGGRHNREEEYFHKQELEVIDKMRRKAQTAALRQRLAERAGIADDELLADLEALGYTVETVMLLHLVPLVQTAWAEGSIHKRERDAHCPGRPSPRRRARVAGRSAARTVADRSAVG